MAENKGSYTPLSIDLRPRCCTDGTIVSTCRSCAGNPPRNPAEPCTACKGYGFFMYACSHVNSGSVGTSTPSVNNSSFPRTSGNGGGGIGVRGGR